MDSVGFLIFLLIALLLLAGPRLFRAARRLLRRRKPRWDRRLVEQTVVPGRLTPQVIRVGHLERFYLLYIPPGYRPSKPLPLVFVFHGGGGSANGIANTSQMHRLAYKERFIVVYPEGIRGSWNAGDAARIGWAARSKIDDVAFTRAILARVSRDYAVDPLRIYATGMSKGGMLAYHLACCMSETFAAVAPVAATMISSACNPLQPVAIMHVHGTADDRVPIQGGRSPVSGNSAVWPAVTVGIDYWRKVNQCADTGSVSYDDGEVICWDYPAAGTHADVRYCLVQGGGHAWPGSSPKMWQRAAGEHVNQSFSTSRQIWQFFVEHPKPAAQHKDKAAS
jgi:polyhydroxybutyrate depolymerase